MIGGEAQNRSVLITGAAGFGGSHLVRELLDLDWRVTGLDVVAPNHAETLRAEFAHPGSGTCGKASRTSSQRTSPVTRWSPT